MSSIERQLEKVVLDGLEVKLAAYLPRASIIPAFQAKIPALPYLVYRFFRAWKHYGPLLGMNPPLLRGVKMVPKTGTPFLTGTVDYVEEGGKVLVDLDKDFIALGVQRTFSVKNMTTSALSMVTSFPSTERLRLKDAIFPATPVDYEIRIQDGQAWYWIPSLRGLSLTVYADTDFLVDDIANVVRDFFLLQEQANKYLSPLGYLAVDTGEVLVTDEVDEKGKRVRRRDLTVFLKGQEPKYETVPILAEPKVTLQGETPVPIDPTPLLDKPTPKPLIHDIEFTDP